jgi:phage terminase large subunit-like protein
MYEQGRTSFEGTGKHVIWCDEEPPLDCCVEMLYRTITTKGIVLVTFTPLQGMSAVVTSFLEPETEEARAFKTMIQAGWDDVPHLDLAEKTALLATTPPFQREARTKGLPQLGAGAIYQLPESDIKIPPFDLPESWPRCWGMDTDQGAGFYGRCLAGARPRDPNALSLRLLQTYPSDEPRPECLTKRLAFMRRDGGGLRPARRDGSRGGDEHGRHQRILCGWRRRAAAAGNRAVQLGR